jgi:hypothetical protein
VCKHRFHFLASSPARRYYQASDRYLPGLDPSRRRQGRHDGLAGRVVVNRSDRYRAQFALVDAGPRQITVQGPPGGTGGVGETRTFPLDVAPCTRYYLVAVKSNRLAHDFTVRVDHQEPVSGCTPA